MQIDEGSLTSSAKRKLGQRMHLFLASFFLVVSAAACGAELRSVSGVVLQGSEILLISDDNDGVLYRAVLAGNDLQELARHGSVALAAAGLSSEPVFGADLASDLEAVALLPSGEPVVLSEGAAALVAHDRVIATYDQSLMQFGGRGLEGLDVYADGRIAALWEGGHPHPGVLPTRFSIEGRVQGPFLPAVCVHRSLVGSPTKACAGARGITALKVPAVPGSSQAFRAPDLVWAKDGSSWLVLLSSINGESTEFHYKWLQRFSLSGNPVGVPLNLCDRGQLPLSLRHGLEGNIEGLGWLDPGKSLLLVNDSLVKTTLVSLRIDPWPETDASVRCDQPL